MNTKTFPAICNYCEAEFTAKRSTASYCSPSCRQMAYIKRSNEAYNRYEQAKKSSMQSVSVNKNSSQSGLASTNNTHSTELTSTNSGYIGAYRQSSVNNPPENIMQASIPDNKLMEKQPERNIIDEIKIEYANKKLKQWITELLGYASRGEIHKYKLKKNLLFVNNFCNYEKRSLPLDYPHNNFIDTRLKPKLEGLLKNMESNKIRTAQFTIDDNFKKEMQDIF